MPDQASPSSVLAPFHELQQWLSRQIIGQSELIERLLIALLADGHLLVEGAPGLAKTRAIKCLAQGIEGDFQRIQFTPDLLPADITGSDIYRPEDHSFVFQQGPVFHNLVLADEINRAPAKVQSALLEAMAERQITVSGVTRALPPLFLVMATQNPIEQEGTYPLPEAQLDRFLMHVRIGYPRRDDELAILQLSQREARWAAGDTGLQQQEAPEQAPLLSQAQVMQARREVLDLFIAPVVERYLVSCVMATREADGPLAGLLDYGASPRATIALDRCARAHAWLLGQDYVSPANLQAVIHEVLRHRVVLNYRAQAEGETADGLIDRVLESVPVP